MLTDNEIKKASDDLLKFEALSETLKEIIISSNTPLTIGLYGEWGSGKTSLMRMTKDLLKDDDNTKTAWFDAWKFDKSDDLRIALIHTILKEIGRDKTIESSLKKDVSDLLKRVNWTGLGIATLNQFLPRPLTFKEATDRLIKGPEDFSQNTLDLIGDFEKEFRHIVHRYVGVDGKLVVFIDDLDRCIPKKTIDILEAIKLFVNVKQSVFIIGADKQVIESGIHQKYPEMYEDWGKKYLDKIIQIPFFLPPLKEDDILGFILNLENVSDDIKKHKEIIAGVGSNPRTIKRLINQFELQKILSEKYDLKVKDGIIAKLAVIQFRQPEFHEYLVKSYDETKINLISKLKKIKGGGSVEQLEEWKKSKDWNIFEKCLEDKRFIKFLFEEPSLEYIELDHYVYLVQSTIDLKDEKIDYYSIGKEFTEKGEYMKAIDAFDKALKIEPDTIPIQYDKGVCLLKSQNYEEAFKCFDRVSVLDPKNVDYKINKGYCKLKNKRYTEADYCFEEALKIDEKNPYTFYLKAAALYGLKKYDKALECIRGSLELDSGKAETWKLKADVLED